MNTIDAKRTEYDERYRPQFHFTAKENWLNDPNGCFYYRGHYHLFFQHNPESVEWGNMTWGHAVSPDLTHWRQLSHAIHPDELGTIYSGSAFVDDQNTSGFKTGEAPPVVAAFTYAGEFGTPPRPYTQALAYSNDSGETWSKYEGNPVLPNQSGGADRDPKLVWHLKTRRWIMVLYLDGQRTFGFFSSKDLKTWRKESECGNFYECPDFFELPVDGDPGNTRWVLHGAAGDYLIGSFDGRLFTPDCESKLKLDTGCNYYAAQSFSNIPDGRRVSIAWMRGGNYPGMPFNQQMTFPCELSLRTTPEGVRLCRNPVKEIAALYQCADDVDSAVLKDDGANPFQGITGELFDVEAVISVGTAKEICFVIRGQVYSYDVGRQAVSGKGNTLTPLALVKGKIKLRFLVDCCSVELFGNDGLASRSDCVIFPEHDKGLDLYVRGGDVTLESCVVRKLNSIWSNKD